MQAQQLRQGCKFTSLCILSTVVLTTLTPTQLVAEERRHDGKIAVCHLDENNEYQLVRVDAERALDHLEHHEREPRSTNAQPTGRLASEISTNRRNSGSADITNLPVVTLKDFVATKGICPAKLKVGDIGPYGGVVYYVTLEGYKGLEVAPTGAVPRLYGCLDQDLDTSEDYFKGWKNTNTIVDEHNIAGAECTNFTAAKYTQDFFYQNPNESGWHLPSTLELISLYEAYVTGVPGLENLLPIAYWSSTDISPDQAFAYDFGAGGFGNGYKDSKLLAIPVHAFYNLPITAQSVASTLESLGWD